MVYYLLVVAGLAVSLLLYMLYLAFQVNVKTHTFPVEKMRPGKQVHLFFISDIHRRKIDSKLIHSLMGKVDIVIIGGDLTEKGVPLHRTEYNIAQLKKMGDVFYVFGNNDREVGEQNLIQLLEKNDVHLLVNKSVELIIDGTPIRLVGVNDGFSGKVSIYDAFQEVREEDIVIFITHAPAYFNNAKKVSKPHLLLAGHLHGGQIRFGPFGIYENGAFKEKEQSAELVSNGFGTTGVPLRLGAKSECHIITIYGE
ncbi:metallophosphoesterase [Psychrobacillus sp. OK032]|uniref:metallophosphoesterase n=1 Tax=Psychrobacillus sp. OK032 TaxID=1884358 RepID=UPI0008C9D9C7|nr:metallophosphoesterase [Psychrobacillus sp. OK032]SES33972.1 Predicted phosphohydrolase, MPP superfamily [Psychrobacillus sp. OK032]